MLYSYPVMSVAYIISEYGKLSRSGGHLVFTNKDGKSRPILLFQTRLLVYELGEAQLKKARPLRTLR